MDIGVKTLFTNMYYIEINSKPRGTGCAGIKTMKKAIVILILTLSFQANSALLSCDIFIKTSEFQRSQESFNKISHFFGFQNGKKTFDITFKEGKETQYWTTQNGQSLEQSLPITSYNGKSAILDLEKILRGDWTFKWTVLRTGSSSNQSKANSEIFESHPTKQRSTLPDYVIEEDSKLIITKSKIHKNSNSEIELVMKKTMTFSKNSDGSIELLTTFTSDSIRGSRILIGDETEYRLILRESSFAY